MCNPVNKPSWKLLERLGFRREGCLIKNVYFTTDAAGNPVWADTYIYAILATEWSSEGQENPAPLCRY
jgi:RimJ/RimL family protein N-acetyltransferase